MTTFRRQLLNRAFKLFDLAAMCGCFGMAALSVTQLTDKGSFTAFLSMRIKLQNILIFLLLLLSWHAIFSLCGLYESRRLTGRKGEIQDVLRATLAGTGVIALLAYVFHIRMIGTMFVLTFWTASSGIGVSSRLLLRSFLAWVRIRGRNLRYLLVVGTNPRAVQFARDIERRPELGYRLLGFVDEEWKGSREFSRTGYRIAAGFRDFSQFLRERVVDEVVLALPMKSLYAQAARIASRCAEQGIGVRLLPQIFELPEDRSNARDADEVTAVTLCGYPFEGWPLACKRALDLILSAFLLLFLAPLFLVVQVVIKWDSAGPVFFLQDRVGLNKRIFRIYKFRTMIAGAETKQAELEARNELDGPVFKLTDDPRITRVGRILRRTSLDELPQLLNVLKGEMSLVGPRPLPVRDYQGFSQDWQRRRFSVRPGMTCLWQVNGRCSVPFERWMDLDMQYIDQWSFWLDLKILLKTVPAVLKGTGAA